MSTDARKNRRLIYCAAAGSLKLLAVQHFAQSVLTAETSTGTAVCSVRQSAGAERRPAELVTPALILGMYKVTRPVQYSSRRAGSNQL